MIKVHVDNTEFKQKPTKIEIGSISNSLSNLNEYDNLRDFAVDIAVKGKTFTPSLFKESRKQDNFLACQFLVMDFDNDKLELKDQATLDEVIKYFSDLELSPFFAYHSFSNSSKCHKFRVIWRLDDLIVNKKVYDFAVNILLELVNLRFNIKSYDKSATTDCSKMFFGSVSGIAYFEEKNIINLADAFEKVIRNCKIKFSTDQNNNTERTVTRLFNRLNVSKYEVINYNEEIHETIKSVNGRLQHKTLYITKYTLIDVRFEDKIYLNLDNLYIIFNKFIYKIELKNTQKQSLTTSVKNNDTKIIENTNIKDTYFKLSGIEKNEILNLDILKVLAKNCCIVEKYIDNKPMKHNDRFVLLGFLLNFNQGIKKYKDYLRKTKNKFTDTNITSYLKKLYITPTCSKKSDSCNKNHNLLSLYINLKKNKVIKHEVETVTIEEARQLLNEKIDYILNSKHDKQKYFILKVDPGAGKTYAILENIIKQKLKNFIMAFKLHDKKSEISIDTKYQQYIKDNIFLSQKLPELKPDDQKILNFNFFKRKNYLNFLKTLLEDDFYNDQDKYNLFKYINSYYEIHKHKKIFTTHAKVPYILESVKPEVLIYDESPDSEFVKNVDINNNDVKQLLSILESRKTKTKNIQTIIRFLKFINNYNQHKKIQIVSTKKFRKIKFNNLLTEKELKIFNPITPIFDIFKANFLMWDNKKCKYIFNISNPLPNTHKVIILSATPDMKLYEKLLGDMLEFIELPKIKPIGKTFRFADKISYSKRSFNINKRKNESLIIENVKKLNDIGISNLISYKAKLPIFDFIPEENKLNYGNLEGVNIFEKQHLMVVGANSLNAEEIQMRRFYLTGEDIKLDFTSCQNIYVENFENMNFTYYTFKDEIARYIHLTFIYNEILQVLGRSRNINNNCTSALLSKMPYYFDEPKTWDDLPEIEEVVKEQNIILNLNELKIDDDLLNFENIIKLEHRVDTKLENKMYKTEPDVIKEQNMKPIKLNEVPINNSGVSSMNKENNNNIIPEGFFRDIVEKYNQRMKLEELELKKRVREYKNQ